MDTLLRESAIIRERLGLRPDDFVLGCVSRFDPVKRLEVRLQDRIPTVVLILVGAVARKTGSAASRRPWVSRST